MPAPTPAPGTTPTGPGFARFAGRAARGVVECVDLLREPERLALDGPWFVVADFEASGRGGRARAWRFAERVDPAEPTLVGGLDVGASPDGHTSPDGGEPPWHGPAPTSWTSSMDRAAYEAAVAHVRDQVREGEVYQVNVCRVLAAPLDGPGGGEPDVAALARRLDRGNPAPYAGALHVPAGSGVDPVWVVSASPELFLRVAEGTVSSGPIKGTATTAAGLTAKDRAENVMITDLVRNDLQRVCVPGTVEVTDLLAVEPHPGLVHLVSRVAGRVLPELAGSAGLWPALLDATFPPASVSGAPKSSALRIIDELETVPRGPYCGAIGWVDGDEAELAVGIRTFWWSDGVLRFGTGAGITWGSDPAREWEEAELKARRLVGLASGTLEP